METEKGSPAENRTSRASRFKGGGLDYKTTLSPCNRPKLRRAAFLFVVLVDIAEERD